jgi:hypothetical protein
MAWMIEDAVAHGEIDNTVEGHTTGRIWLINRDEPLILSLNGDCWRDLAGTRLQFENPAPTELPDTDSLDIDQLGIIGDMTASRRKRVPTVDEEEFNELYESEQDIPFEWRNALYLEWFSEVNGRVVIDSADFILTISPHEWEMDEDAENAQKLANLNSMRDFMAQVIGRRESEEIPAKGVKELDEYAWEERLKESDRVTEAYQEVLEKYMEDADSEQKEAFVMGWDGLLDALADQDEADQEGYDFESGESLEYEEEEDEEDDDFATNEDDHPLQAKAQELTMRAMDLVERDAGPGTPAYQLVNNLLQVSGKLAGALHGSSGGYEPETGFVLAILKRCLNWLNEAVGACQQLIQSERDPERRTALEQLRSSAFEVRDGIVEMRRGLK